MGHCSIAAIVRKIFYIQARTTGTLFLLYQPYLDIKLDFPFFCLTFLCWQKHWSKIVDLPVLTESVLYEFVNPVALTLCEVFSGYYLVRGLQSHRSNGVL